MGSEDWVECRGGGESAMEGRARGSAGEDRWGEARGAVAELRLREVGVESSWPQGSAAAVSPPLGCNVALKMFLTARELRAAVLPDTKPPVEMRDPPSGLTGNPDTLTHIHQM